MSGKNTFVCLTSAVVLAQLVTAHAGTSYSGWKSTTAPPLYHGLSPSAKETAEQREQERAILPKLHEHAERSTWAAQRGTMALSSNHMTMLNEASRPVVLDSRSKHFEHLLNPSEHDDPRPPQTRGAPPDFAPSAEQASGSNPDHVSFRAGHGRATQRSMDQSQMKKEELYSEAFEYHMGRNVTVALWSPHILARPTFLAHYVPKCNVVKAFEDGNYPNVDVSFADVVVFNLGQAEDLIALGKPYLPPVKPKGQMWVAGCWEPRVYNKLGAKGDCSLLNDRVTMSFMDAVASYDADSDFPAFFTPPSLAQMRREAPDFEANFVKLNTSNRPAIASTVTSDCRVDHRNHWFQEIKEAFSERGHPDAILAYGKCNRTIEERSCESDPDDVQREEGPSSIAEVWIRAANRCMAQPFQLISENTQAPWYVTEKVWNAFATGSIPVYDGPPEVKKLVPPGSVLFADDFASTAELVDAMLSLNHTSARAWKQLPPQQWGGWAEGRRLSRATLVPRLCEAAAQKPEVQSAAADDIKTPSRPSREWLEIEQRHNGQKKTDSDKSAAMKSLLGTPGVVKQPEAAPGVARQPEATKKAFDVREWLETEQSM